MAARMPSASVSSYSTISDGLTGLKTLTLPMA
jgi:hypothetical protein